MRSEIIPCDDPYVIADQLKRGRLISNKYINRIRELHGSDLEKQKHKDEETES